MSKFGTVDVVVSYSPSSFCDAFSEASSDGRKVANAGVNESTRFTSVVLDAAGLPKKPDLKTLEINLISVAYSVFTLF